ncbi:hypothetical protein Patl1_34065 [Pistacia atlantica]|uniref:Uncharacterized protein n=1 Tax=Pistacia atlantica TaxID=434234 RepID=A0ACC0ZT37_9ROSI|nr:hypothetical protein Patl1_34065 [Pistacia atlantica]
MDSRLFEAIANNYRGAFDNLVQDNEGILEQRTDYHLSTVLHLASRFRHFELVKDIIELHPEIVETLNKKLVDKGHLDVVKLMMNQSWQMDFEEDGIDLNALHVAPAMGHTDTVQNILEVRPNFARKSNKNGYSPLHCYTPLHLAAIHGKVPILEEFMLSSPTSFQYLTKEGEIMCHLAVKFNQYDALLAMYIVNTPKEIINCCNNKGHTVLEILELSPGNAESKQLKKAVEAAADKNFGLGYQPEVVPTPSSSVSAESRKDSGQVVAVSFMAIAYIAATTVTMPHCIESGWMFEVLLAISVWTVGTAFVYLGLVLTRHWLRKLKWREERGQRRRATATIQGKAQSQHDTTNAARAIYSESTISDVDSSTSLGYHAY